MRVGACVPMMCPDSRFQAGSFSRCRTPSLKRYRCAAASSSRWTILHRISRLHATPHAPHAVLYLIGAHTDRVLPACCLQSDGMLPQLSATPHVRRAPLLCPCLSGSEWCLQSDAVPDFHVFRTDGGRRKLRKDLANWARAKGLPVPFEVFWTWACLRPSSSINAEFTASPRAPRTDGYHAILRWRIAC